ncbi:uncharacterized protein (UPF0548 family) [Saccharopolyspora erythraea NRRL 2338]|uniref:Uncharacterized protein n=2 Tax=Saccharopolyspora erythraea TaxID=1836 RepID=A4FHJ5_SACEN|nr:DUF1990 family protein [Saccharopolyspora erythraea]EQD81454.1 hypothetical protein N599_36080 [Saccharopolyspora erythraea D]PFG97212.1 uncharacterized protein (UPF0548 family) [Saccharopolyspora erythraea NRRL 2338]QRK87409.1 DUF1990 domain-containing protein [Saccharopolyspora erythraea]CAM03520.1 hypothetical protein SACE_4251 [Saccharopolyspora erythraea NRRL 2338]
MRSRLLGGVDYASALRGLRHRRVNFSADEVSAPAWHFDTHRHHIALEHPGPPAPGGAWESARELIRDYEFSPPEIVRAVYDRRSPLLGRDMLLEGRFHGARFHMGVRVTAVTDEVRGNSQRVWGWSYETLEGHLERGRLSYEVVKNLRTGVVWFVIRGFSRVSPDVGPLLRLGWRLFGRRTQLRFYARCGARLRGLVRLRMAGVAITPNTFGESRLVLVPSGTRPGMGDRLGLRWHHPST